VKNNLSNDQPLINILKEYISKKWIIFFIIILSPILFLLILILFFALFPFSLFLFLTIIIGYYITRKDKIIKDKIIKLIDETIEPIVISELAEKQKVSEKKVRQIIDGFILIGSVKGTFTKDGSKFVTDKALKHIFEEKIK